ncbi:hypothetical protein GFJ94_02770 [Flavobacterium sp. LMO8]|uniref:hypothetical protein n=1 Tax=Flavobacterium sp. LMO8 TaxID=2654244 RepID=UPI00129116E4|nr:hypothetical protein [Flavobacterium sp. LMO8]MQP23984.1 hypothetical protein [Flavobacterium sp. LMO8]
MKKLLLLLMFLIGFTNNAQSLSETENYYTPNGLLENVFDNYGNHFKLKDVLIAPKISVIDSTKILTSELLCTSGIFEIYFEKGSGMNLPNNPNHIERRNVVCTVFNELSNFIDSPLKNSGNTSKIKIWIRDIDEIPNAQNFDISYGTSYYNVPKNNNAADISDNQLWKTILSGVDAYKNTSQNAIIDQANFYHATLAF